MGLDMYLRGRKFLPTNWDDKSANATEDGYRIEEHVLDLGYWRKHPDLHGYIVEIFAAGVDDCKPVELTAADLHTIIEAIERDRLPHTEGFFFGTSDGSEKAETIATFTKALEWLETKDPLSWRSIEYRASW